MHSILRLFRRSFFVGFCVCVCSLSLPFLGCHWTRLLFVLFVFLHSLKPFVRLIVMDDRWLQSLSASLMLNFVEHVFNFIGRLYDPIFRFVDALHMIPLIPCTIFSLSLSRFRFLSILFGKCRKSADFCGGIGSFTLHIAKKGPFLELFGGYQLNDMMISFPPTTTTINCNPHLPNIPNRFQSHQKKYSFIWKYQFYFYRSLNFFSSLGSVRGIFYQ